MMTKLNTNRFILEIVAGQYPVRSRIVDIQEGEVRQKDCSRMSKGRQKAYSSQAESLTILVDE